MKFSNKEGYVIIGIVIVFIVFLIVMFSYGDMFKDNSNGIKCNLVKTYTVRDIDISNDGESMYITLKEYQTEGTDKLKVSKELGEVMKSGNNYNIYFDIDKRYVKENNSVIFSKGEVTNIVYTDKSGMDSLNRYSCEEG